MSAAVIHSLESLKLHSLVFRAMAHSVNITFTQFDHFISLSDKYGNMIAAYPAEGEVKSILHICDNADLPSIDDLIRITDWSTFPKVRTTWIVEWLTANSAEPSHRLSAGTVWEFYQKIVKKVPDMPKVIVAWAAYAQPGDSAIIRDAQSNRIFTLKLEKDPK